MPQASQKRSLGSLIRVQISQGQGWVQAEKEGVVRSMRGGWVEGEMEEVGGRWGFFCCGGDVGEEKGLGVVTPWLPAGLSLLGGI